MTAITRTSIVCDERRSSPGEIRVFHQTERIPAIAATNAPSAKASVRRSEHVVAERPHARRVVADALEREPERCADEVAQERVDAAESDERDVEEAWPAPATGCRRAPARSTLFTPPKPERSRHLREEEVGEHRERERDHQEVDAVAPARDRAEEEADAPSPRGSPTSVAEPRVPGDGRAAVGRDEVRHREAGDPVQRDLAERDHPDVAGEEDQAHGGDARARAPW